MAAPTPIRRRVLVVDDEPIMAALISSALESGGFETHACSTARAAREAINSFDPDAAVLDISLGEGATGIDLAHVLDRAHPGVAVLLLTKHADLRSAGYTPADLPANCGLLRKDSVNEASSLIAAVEALLSEQMTRARTEPTGPLAQLTTQQITVLRAAAQGYTSAEIARQRGTSTSAVDKMLAAIYDTLRLKADGEINPRVEAIRIFITNAGVPERL